MLFSFQVKIVASVNGQVLAFFRLFHLRLFFPHWAFFLFATIWPRATEKEAFLVLVDFFIVPLQSSFLTEHPLFMCAHFFFGTFGPDFAAFMPIVFTSFPFNCRLLGWGSLDEVDLDAVVAALPDLTLYRRGQKRPI